MVGEDAAGSSPATDAAAALMSEFVRLGLRDVVVSPGSRSQALALVAADLERRGAVRLHVRIDERVAGFTALGLARESRRPVAVVCTSGTAVANLLPAVVEAHHDGVPLLLLTADRPPELRGVGANQTTHQPGIFGGFVRLAVDAPVPTACDRDGVGAQTAEFRALADDAYAASVGRGSRPGPVHLNLPVREPLAGALPAWLTAGDDSAPDAPGLRDPSADIPASERVLERGPRTVVVAGSQAGPDAERIAFEGGWPLIAEIVSGARFGRQVVHGYRDLLRTQDLGGRIERVVVVGRPTLSREVAALLSRSDIEIIAVAGPGEPINLNGVTTTAGAVSVEPGEHDRAWLGAWLEASRTLVVDRDPPAPDRAGLPSAQPAARLGAIASELQAMRLPVDRVGLVDAVWRASWPHDRLMFGSSRLVRVADAALGGKKVPVHANRGVAGIDGTVATAMGIALASQADGQPGVTRVVLGDLALLHDLGALLLPPNEREPRVQVIVGNDGGGTIFDELEVATVAGDDDMRRVLYTPHDVRFEHLAVGFGWEYHRVTTRAALDQLLTAPAGGRQLIEVPLQR